MWVLQPRADRNPRGLGCAPFARHYWGYHVLFSLPAATKMFQFTGFAFPHKQECQYNILTGCPIRTSAGHRSPAPHRGFSQLATSFIAFLSQGIRPVPFLSFTASLRRTCIRHQDACLCIRRLIVFLLSTTVEVLKSITLGIFSIKKINLSSSVPICQ